MQTLTVQVTGASGLKALQALEDKRVICIVENADFDSPSLPGKALGIKAFKNWVSIAEDSPTIHLKQAKAMGRQKKTFAKTYEVRVTANALQNIDEITGYIAFINQQPLNAIKIGDAIFETIDRISLNPFSFRECEEIPTNTKIYRRALCYQWPVIYRVKAGEIVIPGVIHCSRRPTRVRKLRKIK
jgi:plasmid stabilization system protein ParE